MGRRFDLFSGCSPHDDLHGLAGTAVIYHFYAIRFLHEPLQLEIRDGWLLYHPTPGAGAD